VKVSFERRKIAKVFMTHVQVFFRKSLSKATFEKLCTFVVCRLYSVKNMLLRMLTFPGISLAAMFRGPSSKVVKN